MKNTRVLAAAVLCAAAASIGMLASCGMGGNDYTAEEEAFYDKAEESRHPGCIKVTAAESGDAILQFEAYGKKVRTFSFDVYTEDASLGAIGGGAQKVYCFAMGSDFASRQDAGTDLQANQWTHVEVDAGSVISEKGKNIAGIGVQQCGVKAAAVKDKCFWVDNFRIDNEVHRFRSYMDMSSFSAGYGIAKIEYDPAKNGYDENTGFPQ